MEKQGSLIKDHLQEGDRGAHAQRDEPTDPSFPWPALSQPKKLPNAPKKVNPLWQSPAWITKNSESLLREACGRIPNGPCCRRLQSARRSGERLSDVEAERSAKKKKKTSTMPRRPASAASFHVDPLHVNGDAYY